MTDLFHRLSAFPPTPANAEGHVDDASLSRLVERLQNAGVHSIGLLGSTGAHAFLSRAERRRAIEIARDAVGGTVPLIVGVGALRTDEAIALARDAAAAGADGLLLAPVSYTPLTDEEVYQHFVAVAGASSTPLCIYNNPSTTKFTFSARLLERLSQIDAIVAVKMPLPAEGDARREIAELRSRLGKGFAIGYSGDWGAADALLAGADAWYSVIAGLLPRQALALTAAARGGDQARTLKLNAAFEPLWELFREFGSFRVVYAIGDILGLFHADPPRPVLPLGASERQRVAEALETFAG
ncbi:dihydrodipicolinate synthase family protein [Oryzifoliimicrobium ureilyticus]|uniref:dihydrodipicolinate synthase family protein n=1 Tax=Oryzifoliimicrobium ureilyticus TaxID=3113724 RepID=UPI0030760DE3